MKSKLQLLYLLSGGLALGGFFVGSAVTVSIANILLGLGYTVISALAVRRGMLTAISFFALASGVAGLGNLYCVLDAMSANPLFVGYGNPKYYLQATFMNYMGTAMVLVGASIAEQISKKNPRGILPKIDPGIRDHRATAWIVFALGIVALINTHFTFIRGLGKLSGIISLLPAMSVFLLARKGYQENNRRIIVVAICFAGLLSCNALLYTYLRGEILFPWVAFLFGSFIGRPQLRTFMTKPYIMIYIIIVIFFSYFASMGLVRTERVYGVNRLSRLQETRKDLTTDSSDKSRCLSLVRRGTVKKQSRIIELTVDNGFYMGKSMSYYKYVFIPRFIWRNKPIIQKGGWFASELGLGHSIGGGKNSNAINMTVPGELYLNFGWFGLVIGCMGMGFIVRILWQTTNFWQSADNILGNLFAFSLIKRCMEFLGPDMQSLVGYIATYLIFLMLTLIIRFLVPKKFVHRNSAHGYLRYSAVPRGTRRPYPPKRNNYAT